MDQKAFSQILNQSLIKGGINSNHFLAPEIITNQENDCFWHHLKYELSQCKSFIWAVAFFSRDMLAPLKVILKDLANKGVRGTIITGTYLGFNHPAIFRELSKIPNIKLRIVNENGFHMKGYMFDHGEYQTAYIGSANFTRNALIRNHEWNLRISSLDQGEFVQQLNDQIKSLYDSSIPITKEWIDFYEQEYTEPVHPNKTHPVDLKPLCPNEMQKAALAELENLYYHNHAQKGLIVSATGTGKTYLAAFWAKRFAPKRMLFIVHREQILKTAMASFQCVLGGNPNDYGILTGNYHQANRKYVFATVQTISQLHTMNQYDPDEFDLIIIDEAHHSVAKSYRQILSYFTPKFWLGMTATPERMDQQDIFKLFDYHLAYEIRLQEALSNDLLCPFHYIGIDDIEINGHCVDDLTPLKSLTSTQRVDYILEQIEYYTDTELIASGLIFCSRTAEAEELAQILSKKGHPAIALTNKSSAHERTIAIRKLECHRIEYLVTVDLFNEGIDIPCLNQIIMLRNTKSSIIFTQQLGRGLRKFPGKQFVTVLDFIGNYQNNYLIPVALYGDHSCNYDDLKDQLVSTDLIGISTINFTTIAQERILKNLAHVKLNSMQTFRLAYQELKEKLGRSPLLVDFEKFGTIDAAAIINNPRISNYGAFLMKMGERVELTDYESKVLTMVTKEIANGKRIHELLVMDDLLHRQTTYTINILHLFNAKHVFVNKQTIHSVIQVLTLNFFDVKAGKTTRKEQYGNQSLIEINYDKWQFSASLQKALAKSDDFKALLTDAIQVGLMLNQKYQNEHQFTLYQKYSRKDVCRLLNWSKDVSAPLYGYRISDDVCPIFITYHQPDKNKRSANYENDLTANSIIKWYTRSPRHLDSNEVQKLLKGVDKGKPAVRIEIFIKRDDAAGKEFTYIGQGKIIPGSAHEEQIISKTTHRNQNVVAMDIQLQTPMSLKELRKIID